MHIRIIDAVGILPRASECEIPGLRRPARSACLTDFLDATPDLVAGLLPQSRRAITALNRRVLSRPQIPASHTTVNRRLYATVAGAVDRGVLYLSGFDISTRISRRLPTHGRWARLRKALVAYRPPRRGVLRSRSAMGWLYVLGALDPVLRGFRTLDDIDISGLATVVTEATAREWLERVIPEDVSNEIGELLRTISRVRLPGPILANPVFGGLGPVIGSDGDWIAGDTLVELKCTTRGVKRTHVAQLLAYYVFDQCLAHGRRRPYGFTRLALCLPRQSCTVVGTVDEWLQAFGAPEPDVFVRGCAEWFARN